MLVDVDDGKYDGALVTVGTEEVVFDGSNEGMLQVPKFTSLNPPSSKVS